MLTVICFQWWAVCLLPFVIPLSKAIVHRCSRCSQKLAVAHPFGLPNMKDEVVTLKCGDCAVVLSRRYVLVAGSLVASMIIAYWVISVPVPMSLVYSNVSWTQYLKDCGGEVVLRNSVRATTTFSQMYEGKTVSWDGYLLKVKENPSVWFRDDHAVVILVKMQPSESDIHADLLLSMDDEVLGQYRTELASLDKGSHFAFNATFVSVGTENNLHHLHGLSIEKLEGFLQIADHVHLVNHRYNVAASGSVQMVQIRTVPPIEPKGHDDVHRYTDTDTESKAH
mmetsp:Transcript_12997/g.24121  ORF Transcript_12997/g.24121 Transcript_12997/m.24121 type:complete len:281 (-) Transcript_12997:2742-3584(-)